MKLILSSLAMVAVTTGAALANGSGYHVNDYGDYYSGRSYSGDPYQDWHPEFRGREARYYYNAREGALYHRYRGQNGYAIDDDYEDEYWVGNCRVEREWERDGGYEEEVDCD